MPTLCTARVKQTPCAFFALRANLLLGTRRVFLARRVLIVEDEPNIVESLRFLLEREGLDVAVQSDGAFAIDSVVATQPDLVILDVMLPNRSGFDILRDLHKIPGTRPKVMVLTAKGQARDRETAEEIGVDNYMTKPFSNKEIVAAVLRMVA